MKLKLNASELKALNTHLFDTIGGQPIEHLRASPIDFLVCSVLKEVYDKTSAKVEDIRMMPRRTDQLYSVSLSRSQATAVVCSLEVTTQTGLPLPPLLGGGTYEEAFLGRLYCQIHRTYLV